MDSVSHNSIFRVTKIMSTPMFLVYFPVLVNKVFIIHVTFTYDPQVSNYSVSSFLTCTFYNVVKRRILGNVRGRYKVY